MMNDNTSQTNSGGNVCLDVGVDLKTDHLEGEDKVEDAPEDLIDR